MLTVAALGAWLLTSESAVVQPIAFPHKTHLELKEQRLVCKSCHEGVETKVSAGRPSAKKCLSCHSGETKSAEEKKLQALVATGREIPWQRVWRLPPHVFFSHQTHVALVQVKCQTCHGPMETLSRPPARALKTLTMNDCIGCHDQWQWPREAAGATASESDMEKAATTRRVSTDCNACHR